MQSYRNETFPFPHYKTTISKNYFFNNQANVVLSKDQSGEQASSIYLQGTFDVSITENKFRGHKNDAGPFLLTFARDLFSYMPKDYFEYSHAPILRLSFHSDSRIEGRVAQSSVEVRNNEFKENYNY